jgi:hypothetical protein
MGVGRCYAGLKKDCNCHLRQMGPEISPIKQFSPSDPTKVIVPYSAGTNSSRSRQTRAEISACLTIDRSSYSFSSLLLYKEKLIFAWTEFRGSGQGTILILSETSARLK